MSRFDVFLSYSTSDRSAVEYLARRLRDAGITFFLDAWHLIPGERWGSALETALAGSGACAILFGRERGPWQDEEMYSAFVARGTDRDFRVIPVLLPGTSSQQLPLFFRGRTWIDFSAGLDDEKALARLIAGIRGEAPELEGGPGAPIRQRIDVTRYTGRETAGQTDALFHEQSAGVFVGREAETAEVEQFLSSRASGLLLIRGAAGSGKTTLLSRLVQSLRQPGRHWIHHFFSSESRSLAEAYLHVARQLCLHHGIDLPVFPDNPARLRDLIYGLVEDRGPGPAEALIFAFDALDEAEQAFAPMFPAELRSGVFVIATVRDVGAAMPENLERWSEAAAHQIVLRNLSRDAVGDWVRVACDKTGALHDLDALAARVYDVTGGYPLYTRFLIDDVASALRDGRDPLSVFAASPRGFAGYVREQLRMLARERTLQGQKSVQRLFAVLAEARGELSAADLEVLCDMSAWELQALPWEITRWLRIRSLPAGDDRFVFTHPLLAAEFSHILGEAAKSARHALIEYCKGWREHRSSYALQHLAGHLVAEGQTAALHQLLTESPQWMEARGAAEGSISGYLSDIDLAFRNLPRSLTEQWSMAVQLDVARQSVRARSAAATDEALQLFSLLGQEREAEELARMRPSGEARFRAWLSLADLQADPATKSNRIAAARTAALGISDPVERVQALVSAARMARTEAVVETIRELMELASAGASELPPDARAQIACDLVLLADTDFLAATWRAEAVRLAAEEPSAARPYLAVQLARIGAVEEAFSLVEKLPSYRESALEEIAESLASQGHVAQAFDALDRARAKWIQESDGDWVNRVPRALKALLQAGGARGILDRLPAVPDESLSWGFEPASLIASAAVAAGDLPLAHAAAARVPYAPQAGEVLAVAATTAGVPPETADELLAEAMRRWRELPRDHRDNVGLSLLTALADRGRLDDALEVLGPVRESGENSAAAFRVASAAVRAGEVARAMAIVEPLGRHADTPAVRASMISLGIELARAGRIEEARSAAANVEHGWTAEEEPFTGSVLAALATSLFDIGHPAAARICVEEALRLVELPHLTLFERETALMHVAAASAHVGTEDSVALAQRITSGIQRSRALIHAVGALVRHGRLNEAAEALRGVDDVSPFGDPLQTRFIRGLYEVAVAAHVREDEAMVEEMHALFVAGLRSRRDAGLTTLSPRPDLWVATTFDWMALLVACDRPDRAADLFTDFITTLSSDLQAQVIPDYLHALEDELTASGLIGEASLLRPLLRPADGARLSGEASPATPLPECIDALREPHSEGLAETLAIAAYGTSFAEELQHGLGSATVVDALRVAGWSDAYWKRIGAMIAAALSTPAAAVVDAVPTGPQLSRQNLGRVSPSIRAALHGLIGDLHRDRAEWEDALTAYQRAADEDPERNIWLLRRAWAELATGQFDEALRAFRQIHARWPEDSDATKGEAMSLLDIGNAAAAVSAFSRPEAKAAENTLYWRALAHLDAGNREEFAADLTADEAAASGLVVDALRQFWRAVAAGAAGDAAGARTRLDASRASIAAAPSLARRKLGGLLAAYEGDQSSARTQLEVCFRNPEDPWAHSTYRTYLRLLARLASGRDGLKETLAWFEARCPGAGAR